MRGTASFMSHFVAFATLSWLTAVVLAMAPSRPYSIRSDLPSTTSSSLSRASRTTRLCLHSHEDFDPATISTRRRCFLAAIGGIVSAYVLDETNRLKNGSGFANERTIAYAASLDETPAVHNPIAPNTAENESAKYYRTELIQAIQSHASEDGIIKIIDKLITYDPSKKAGATMMDDLDGQWKLLWSAKAEAFSPLLKLPKPLKPESYQYFGRAASTEAGPDRVAQGLTGGILTLSNELWLSSGTQVAPDDPSVLEIFPPFRLEWGGTYQSGRPKTVFVNAESDAEFRRVNARTIEAQAATKNRYKQLYLERNGRGSLRISRIVDGDPVIVGATFVHEKL